ncbi:hypothetical protein DSH37_21920, partial [Escherichia coli]|nr:hypothetical protein [Escherichia coli]
KIRQANGHLQPRRHITANLKANAKISDLEVHTVLVKTGEAFPMCKNFQISIFGAVVTSG